jgi:hypothetical protein
MKCYFKLFFIALLALAAFCYAGAVADRALANEQQAKAAAKPAKASPAAQDQDVEETAYGEDEYNALMAASNEPDLQKRGDMLLDFIQKYPKTTLLPHVNSAYSLLLRECSSSKKYELLQAHAEKWLKLHPNDVITLGYIAEAANNLLNFDKCAECMEEIYKLQPSPTLAKEIFQVFQKTKNLGKQIDWADRLLKMPEFDSDFMLRFGFVSKYTESNNFPKAAEYAQLTLKSVDLVKQSDAQTQEQMRKVRHASNHVIGMNLYEKDKYAEAIVAFSNAIRYERYGIGYYYIGQCLERQDKIEDANIAYAKAELLGGEIAPKAKARLEQLYKALHNNLTIGIEKVYKKAKEELGTEK